jgi:aspartyl-tRNA(Asn)/glutamyl-tRNA(Gln) amidotransferase subunit A
MGKFAIKLYKRRARVLGLQYESQAPKHLQQSHSIIARIRAPMTSKATASMREHPAFAHLEAALAAANTPRAAHVMLRVDADDARLALMHAHAKHQQPTPALFGWTVSVKDLFDVAGQVTGAGAPSRAHLPPAQTDAPAVARLKAAGAIVVGRSNMTEFAFSGVGVNPHWGTPANPADTHTPRITGGSSSGAAASVGLGIADIGLGSDTGGSLRIPAALCGLVGFKGTAGVVPLSGAYPLSTSLDTVGAITATVDQAIAVHQVLAQQPVAHWAKPLSHLRLGVCSTVMQDGLDSTVQAAWDRSLQRLRDAGVTIVNVDTSCFGEITSIQHQQPLASVEAYGLHKAWLREHESEYDPRVLKRIRLGSAASAADYITMQQQRQALKHRVAALLQTVDAVISPTVPITAPAIAQVAPGAQRDDVFFAINAQLLRNPSTVNFVDGCAISLPCHLGQELPVGLMVWHSAGMDAQVLGIAKQLADNVLAQPL